MLREIRTSLSFFFTFAGKYKSKADGGIPFIKHHDFRGCHCSHHRICGFLENIDLADTCWRSIGGGYVDSSSLSEVDMADDRREQDCEMYCVIWVRAGFSVMYCFFQATICRR